MLKKLAFAQLIAFALMLGACSTSKTGESENPDDIPMADAETDAVPMEGAETPPADPALDGAPSPDALAETNAPQDPAAPAATQDPNAQAPADPNATAASTQTQTADQGTGATEDYTVQTGDTLMSIAFETYGDLFQWRKIYDLNQDKISNPSALSAGTVLKIEKPAAPVSIERNGERYLIRNGDTLGTISDDVYGTKSKWRKLWENNKQLIRDPNKIFAGFYLYYQMTQQDRQEAEQLKQGRGDGQPLAETEAAPAPAENQAGEGASTPAAAMQPAQQATDVSRAPAAAGGVAAQ